MWSFDVFALNDASGDHALKFVFYELLTRYDLINRFKVCQQTADFHCLDQSLQICVPVILYIYYSISKVLITFMLMNGSINKSKKKRCWRGGRGAVWSVRLWIMKHETKQFGALRAYKCVCTVLTIVPPRCVVSTLRLKFASKSRWHKH